MSSEHNITRLDESSSRQIWVGWGCSLVCIGLAYFIGGSFGPFLLLFIGATTALRGHQPGWFIRHIDAQIISGIPYRREESWRSWILALTSCLLLALFSSALYKKFSPQKPDLATTILRGVQDLLKNQPRMPTPGIALPKTQITKSPHKAPTQPPIPSRTTISPWTGPGQDQFPNVPDDQLGNLAIEEADKVETFIKQELPEHMPINKGRVWIFSNLFRERYAQHVKDLRNSIRGRLGPPAEDDEEEYVFASMFREIPLNPNTPSSPAPPGSALDSVLNPTVIFDYMTYLRRLGRKLKERDVPRLNFSEAAKASDLPDFPYEIFVTIETPQQLADGYILVKFDAVYDRPGCDFEGWKPISSTRLSENDDLFKLLANRLAFAFETGGHLFLP